MFGVNVIALGLGNITVLLTTSSALAATYLLAALDSNDSLSR